MAASADDRLSAPDRLAAIESLLASHGAKFEERQRAEEQAQTERQLAAAAVQQALQEAALASAKALEAALKNANDLELERVARVRDEVQEVKQASITLVNERQQAQDKFEDNVKERFSQVNEFRGSLDDLGKSMGTRRELETLQESSRNADQARGREINELRSRLDVGPAALSKLQTGADERTGRDQQFTASRIEAARAAQVRLAIYGILATFLGGSVFVAVLHAIGAL